jgi:hypothetical protein
LHFKHLKQKEPSFGEVFFYEKRFLYLFLQPLIMKHLLKLSQLTLILFIFTFCEAQDILVKTDSTRIECLINKITEFEVSYKTFDNQSGPSYVIQKFNVAYIIYKNGIKEIITAPPVVEMIDPSSIIKNSIRFNTASPLFGHISAEYERQIRPQIGITCEFGYIGLRSNLLTSHKANGVYGTAGLRVYNKEFRRPYRGEKNDVVVGGYLFTKLHAETFSATLRTQNSQSLSRYDFRNSSLGFSLGGGSSFHFFRFLNIDMGCGLGYNLLQTHLPTPTIYLKNNEDAQTHFSQINLSELNNLYVEMTFAIGFNF